MKRHVRTKHGVSIQSISTKNITVSRPNIQGSPKSNKKMGKTWEQLLYISSGRLELSKCFWVPIVWKWRSGRPYTSVDMSRRHKELVLRESETHEEISIPKKRSKDAEKRLGVWSNCNIT